MEIKNVNLYFRGGKDREGEMRYNPFRITPYLLKVQGKEDSQEEEESCCLALAERIISGYEGTIMYIGVLHNKLTFFKKSF